MSCPRCNQACSRCGRPGCTAVTDLETRISLPELGLIRTLPRDREGIASLAAWLERERPQLAAMLCQPAETATGGTTTRPPHPATPEQAGPQ